MKPKPTKLTPSQHHLNWINLPPTQQQLSSLSQALNHAYTNNTFFTTIGSCILIAIAPIATAHHVIDSTFGQQAQEQFFKLYKSLTPIQPQSLQAKSREPHIFALANTLYFALRRTNINQSLILRGESGSGKTRQTFLVMTHLARLARSNTESKRDLKLVTRMRALHTVLSAFGNASTRDSPDASQFGAFYELQFSIRGKMIGMKTIPLLFNRDRVVSQDATDRSFHAFYHLVIGAPNDIKHMFKLSNVSFPYLPQHSILSNSNNNLDYTAMFTQLVDALKVLGLGKRSSHYIFKLMAAILHIGRIEFQEDEFNAHQCIVKNQDVMHLVSNMLEVDSSILHTTLTSRSNLVGRDLVTQLLTTSQAVIHRDNLAKVLYHVLFLWIVEHANEKLCVSPDHAQSLIYLVDFPGDCPTHPNLTDQNDHMSVRHLCNDFITDFVNHRLLVYGNDDLRAEGLAIHDGVYIQAGKSDILDSLTMNQQQVESLPGDFISLIRGGNGYAGSSATVFQTMFSDKTLNMDEYTQNSKTAVRARTIIRRAPSFKRRVPNAIPTNKQQPKSTKTLVDQLQQLITALDGTQVRVVYCIAPNRADKPSSFFDESIVSHQLAHLQVPSIVNHVIARHGDYSNRMPLNAFATKFSTLLPLDQQNGMHRDVCARIMHRYSLLAEDMHIGPSHVILHDDTWTFMENMVRKTELELKNQAKQLDRHTGTNRASVCSVMSNMSDAVSEYSDNNTDDGCSELGAESVYAESVLEPSIALANKHHVGKRRISRSILPVNTIAVQSESEEEDEERHTSSSRKKWVALTWCLTWWIPTCCIRLCGRMIRPDVQFAWREKVAICLLIFFICAFQLFLIIGFGRVICPRQNLLNVNELFYRKSSDMSDERLVGIHGAIYDLQDFESTAYHSPALLNPFAGLDISQGFPRVPQYYCDYAREFAPDFPPIGIDKPGNGSFIYTRHRQFYESDLFLAQRRIDISLRQNVKMLIGWDPNVVRNMSTDARGENRNMFILGTRVYDIQPYINAAGSQKQFIPSQVIEYIRQNRGKDLSDDNTFLKWWLNDVKLRDCFNNLFIIGVVDYRKSLRCQLTNYILLAFSVLLAAVIGGKFLAAIQFGAAGVPENLEKFVIIQVPSYTEGEDSLRKCIDSLSSMRYDDKRKLLFLVCDGMVCGAGNDRSTPRIILDILGVDPSVDPEPLSFLSLGEGMKQHNMAKVYSGLYESMGHLVPFIVIVKVGKPTETVKPGNRGKRDSQMILMRFLNKVSQDKPMSPLELEIYYQIKNVIGVDPSFYEYCLMVDSDTVVFPDSLTRLAAAMMHDVKVMGVCGETQLANEKDTWATMIQVYEYYISHHLSKAFESLFGSVTCLPGCFTMYRIRTHNKSLPLLVSNEMIADYGCTNVDTLHKKNLLHLGEDRYLTTLMLKHFPNMKTIFAPNAKCQTIAPESWHVLLSQRRRWINSTIHNLVELLRIEQLCGFCCFSMRFVVMIDLVGTLVQPAIMGYLIYLIYMVIISVMNNDPGSIPVLSLVLLGIIYGLQALLFLLKREWQHIGWMVIYILAIPVFSFFIPVYSFWKNDDFSWGNTRIVIGESGSKKKGIASGEEAEPFDISMIPHQPWSQYERDRITNHVSDDDTQQINEFHHVNRTSTASLSSHHHHDMTRVSSSLTLGTEFSVTQMYGENGGGTFPTDAELYSQVQRIVMSADLMVLTKKQVRQDLTDVFHVDLSSKKEYINSCISEILAAAQSIKN